MARRVLSLLVLVLGLAAGDGACAQDRPGLYLDPQQLPPDTRPGECVTRRVTGPGGAYRWERIECAGGGRWDYGRAPLRVEDGFQEGVLRGDRYGGWSRGYDRQPGGDPYHGYPIYRVAGRDADGFLVWPGKRP